MFDDPNMAALAAFAASMGQSSTPQYGPPKPFGPILGQAAGNAFAGAGTANNFAKSTMENQATGLSLERMKAMQPMFLKQIQGMGQPMGVPGGADSQFGQAYNLAMMSGDMGKAATVLQSWAEHNPELAGKIKKEQEVNTPRTEPIYWPGGNAPSGNAGTMPADQKNAAIKDLFGGEGKNPTPPYKINIFDPIQKDQAKEWSKTDNEINSKMGDYLTTLNQSRQRLTTIADALKETQSGGFQSHKADILNKLQGVGITIPEDSAANVASIQTILHEQGINTLQQLKQMVQGAGGRITNAEFERIGNYMNGPDIQPETNLQLLGEAIGAIDYDKARITDWNNMGGLENRSNNGFMLRPSDHEMKWGINNDMSQYVNKAKGNIGLLKGMKNNSAVNWTIKNGQLVKQ